MKRLFCIIILLIFLVNFTGFYVYFFSSLTRIHHEMRAKLKMLPDTELEMLTLTVEEYNKSKVEDHEIKVNDRMYDVGRVEFTHDCVIVYALHDEAEDNLLAFVQKIIDQPLQESDQIPQQIFLFIALNFVIDHLQISFISEGKSIQSNFFYSDSSSEENVHRDYPPPKLV